jgi:hypothetical protein
VIADCLFDGGTADLMLDKQIFHKPSHFTGGTAAHPGRRFIGDTAQVCDEPLGGAGEMGWRGWHGCGKGSRVKTAEGSKILAD